MDRIKKGRIVERIRYTTSKVLNEMSKMCCDRLAFSIITLVFTLIAWMQVFFAFPNTSLSATFINNSASAEYRVGSLNKTTPSNIVKTQVCSKAIIQLLKYAPSTNIGESIIVSKTYYVDSIGAEHELAPPVPVGSSTGLDLNNPITLISSKIFHAGEPIFIKLIDDDHNVDPTKKDIIKLNIKIVNEKNQTTLDEEIIKFYETDVNTGIFVGYIQSSRISAVKYDGILNVKEETKIIASYEDKCGPDDNSTAVTVVSAVSLVDPFGKVFDTSNGKLLNGIKVTLIDANTNLPATVFGDDGVSTFPSTVITGSIVKDSSGVAYTFPTGEFRFPLIPAGDYILKIQAPSSYKWPSTVSDAKLNKLPNGPFQITIGSRGEIFNVPVSSLPINIDIPLDPTNFTELFITKNVNKDVASIGDFLKYKITVENVSNLTVNSVKVKDILPLGFKFIKGSVKVNGITAQDPFISSDGRTLEFLIGNIASNGRVELTYVAQVGVGTSFGSAKNIALATGSGGAKSNLAKAEVIIKDELFQSTSFIIGKVLVGCDPPDISIETKSKPVNFGDGIAGVRIYMEDGTYVITDENGMYHFEGVKPGTHVLQVDKTTIPKGYELILVEENTRYADTPYSQFVDLQGGTLWRADFYVCPNKIEKPQIKEKVYKKTSNLLNGKLVFELNASLQENENSKEINYNASLELKDLKSRNVRIFFALPEGVELKKKSSFLNNSVIEPEFLGNKIVYNLNHLPSNYKGDLVFNGKVSKIWKEGNFITDAYLVFYNENEREIKIRLFDDVSKDNDLKVKPNIPSLIKSAQEKGNIEEKEILANKEDSVQNNENEAQKKQVVQKREISTIDDITQDWVDKDRPGFEFILPKDGYYPPLPTLDIAVKYFPSSKIKLFLNGSEVEGIFLDSTKKSSSLLTAVTSWAGVNLKEGDNVIEAVEYDGNGKETGRIKKVVHYSGPPVKVEYLPEKSKPIADGKNPVIIAVKLYDKDGHPARNGVVGEYKVLPPYMPLSVTKDLQINPLSKSSNEMNKYIVKEDGIALIELAPTAETGEAVLKFNLIGGEKEIRAWIKPEKRDWIVVGLGEGTIGLNSYSGNKFNFTSSGIEDGFTRDGRFAFFAKGMLDDNWLLTLSYDTDRINYKSNNKLFSTIDPAKYYTLYGDKSQQQYEAQSSKPLYAKLEKDKFYALYGDFQTGLNSTELAKYNRSFTGVKTELKEDMYELLLFISDTNQQFVRDELRGNGTSGLYKLSKKNIIINSEKITIEIRHRFKSELIITSKVLSRYIDYTVDYDTGNIFFKAPIPSYDENLNPVYIIAEYEISEPSRNTYNYGGRGLLKLFSKRVELGLTFIHEDSMNKEGDLYELDVKFVITEKITFKAEVAETKTNNFNTESSGTAYVTEVTYNSEKLKGKIYYREIEKDFGLGQQNASEVGTRKVGFTGSYSITKNIDLNTEIFRQYNLSNDNVRDLAELKANYRDKKFDFFTGLRYAKDTLTNGEENISEQILVGGAIRFLENKLTLKVQREQSLNNNENVDFPTKTMFGADYALNDKVAFFAVHEILDGKTIETETTKIGMKASPWNGGQVNSSLEQQYTENGVRVFSVMGLQQIWQLNEKLSLSAGLDRSYTVKKPTYRFNNNAYSAGTDSDFTAVSLGAGYKEKLWNWNGRVEYRDSQTEDKAGVFSSIYGEVKEGIGLGSSIQFFYTKTDSTEKIFTDLRFGVVYRPKNTTWTLLDRIDLIIDKQNGGDQAYNSWRIVNIFNANYKDGKKTQFSIQYGFKYVNESIDDKDYSGYTDVVGFEGRYDIRKDWDMGLRFKMLNSWSIGQHKFSVGPTIGYTPQKNIWISLGYNLAGFTDRDFSKADYTSQGLYFNFRLKFDQETVKNTMRWLIN